MCVCSPHQNRHIRTRTIQTQWSCLLFNHTHTACCCLPNESGGTVSRHPHCHFNQRKQLMMHTAHAHTLLACMHGAAPVTTAVHALEHLPALSPASLLAQPASNIVHNFTRTHTLLSHPHALSAPQHAAQPLQLQGLLHRTMCVHAAEGRTPQSPAQPASHTHTHTL